MPSHRRARVMSDAGVTSFIRRGRRFQGPGARGASTGAPDVANAPEAGVNVDAAAAASIRRGTRAGLYSRTLISSGVADVDDLLGGGVPLGATCAFAGDDASVRCERVFACYGVAEGVASGHRVCWVRPGAREDAMRMVPRRVNDGDVARGGSDVGGDAGQGRKDGKDAEKEEEEEDDGLRIAWQYRRYLKEGRALDDSRVGASQVVRAQPLSSSSAASVASKAKKLRAPDMCHRYDATKEEDAGTLAAADISFKSFGIAVTDAAAGDDDRWSSCYQFVAKFVRETNDLGETSVGRVVVQPETPSDEDGWARCVQLVRALKGLTYDTNCSTMIILALESAPARVATLIRHVVDCAVDVQALDGPTSDVESLLPDPHTCIGLVAVRKIQFQGSIVSPLVRMDRVYALQMRRKRMAIKPLQLRPEDDSRDAPSSACGTGAKGGLDDF